MVSYEKLLSYPDLKLPFTVHTYASDKQSGAVISKNKKHIAFFSIRLWKPQCNYTTTEKELFAIVECIRQFQGILFGYEINVFLYHNNLVYDATLSESQRVMHWQIILEEFEANIQHIDGVDNIVADTLSRFLYTPSDKYYTCTRKAQCCANELLALGRVENKKYCFPLIILIVQIEKQKELININFKLSTYISDWGSGYSMQALDNIEIIWYDSKIYVPQSLRGSVLDWCHFYHNNPAGSRLAKKTRGMLLERPCQESGAVC